MKTCICEIQGTSLYSQSRPHEDPKLPKETADAYDLRTWRSRLNTNDDGVVVIPSMALKQAIDKCAKVLGIQIPGRGKNTYTKHFLAGCMLEDNVIVRDKGGPIHADAVISARIHCNADGVRGSGKRVFRTFPIIPAGWTAKPSFIILDDQITQEVFEHHLVESGKYVGIGRFRPENGGTNGRFVVKSFKWG
jgi:hypothetical protein